MWEWRWGVVGRMRSWFLGMSRREWGGFRLFCFGFVLLWLEGGERNEGMVCGYINQWVEKKGKRRRRYRTL